MKKIWKKKEKETQPKTTEYSLAKDVYGLVVKIMEIIALLGLLYVFVFGMYKCRDISMAPAIQDGDLVVYYKLDKNYVVSDTIVLEYKGQKQVRRVIAREGDVVDITERGLEVNGSVQQEPRIYEETAPYKDQVEFPLKVGRNQVFVLGDARESAVDSRVYGAVDVDGTLGQVFAIVRRRSI